MNLSSVIRVCLSGAIGLGLGVGASPSRAARVDVQVLDQTGHGLAETVVFLESPAASAAVRPVSGAEVEQKAKRFTQRLTLVTVGSTIDFPNRDKVRHHVFSFSPAKTFEIKLYAGRPENPVLFDKPGVVVLGCNIHDSMLAWVVVMDTPYYAQSNAQGELTLPNVPAGSYRLRTWHPDMAPGEPPLDQALLVEAGAVSATVRVPLTAAR